MSRHPVLPLIPARTADTLSLACVALGGASIIASIAMWANAKGESAEETAHAERFGIFVGLWAPTFLILGDYLRRSSLPAVELGEGDEA